MFTSELIKNMDAILMGLLGTLIGGFIGNRLALGRDKRVEYNSVTRPLKQKLLKHYDRLRIERYHLLISDDDIEPLRSYISEVDYKSLVSAFDIYNAQRLKHFCVNRYGDIEASKEQYELLAKTVLDMSSLVTVK
jgi:hypothetical protein